MKKGIQYLLPSFLVATAIATALSGGMPAVQAMTPDAGQTYTAPEKKGTATKTKKSAASGKKTTSYTASGDLSKCADGTYYGTGKGYAGTIKVKVVIKSHEMKSIDLVKVQADDAAYVAKAKGVISAMLKAQSLDVDTISGATYSSNGIIQAVEDAIQQAQGKSAAKTQDDDKKSNAVQHDSSLDGQTYKDGIYYGAGKGFNGTITVKVTIKTGKISAIAITKNEGDDQEYLNKAKGVIRLILKTQSTKVDAVSGATYSSNGIIKAVENALKKAIGKNPEDSDSSGGDASSPTNPSAPEKPTEPSVPENPDTDAKGLYVDGTYTGFARGYKGMMYVSVLISGEKITNIEVTKSDDDRAYLDKAKNLISKIIKNQKTEGVDVITGATYSSNGILDSVNKALVKALKPIIEDGAADGEESNAK